MSSWNGEEESGAEESQSLLHASVPSFSSSKKQRKKLAGKSAAESPKQPISTELATHPINYSVSGADVSYVSASSINSGSPYRYHHLDSAPDGLDSAVAVNAGAADFADDDFDGGVADAAAAKKGNPSLGIMYLTVFVSSMGFTVVLPSLWFYVKYLQGSHPDKSFLGWVVASYSVGQFVGSLAFGAWSNRRRTIEPLIVSLVISVLSNVYYGMAEDIPPFWFAKYHLIISRFIVGFGAGNVSLCRAFVSEATTLETRSAAMTIMGAAQGVGFVLGPGLGFALTYIPRVHASFITLDGYTAAGFASALLILANAVLLPFTFRDLPSKEKDEERVKAPPMTRSEFIPMALTMWMFFVILTGFSVFETITGPLTQDYFGWGDTLNGLLVLSVGIVAVLVFGVLGFMTKKTKVTDKQYILYGMTMVTGGFFFAVPYWGTGGMKLWQLMMTCVGVGLGYPVASSITYALFSKVISPVAQGDKMGYLTAAGSLARILGPVWATYLYGVEGDDSYNGTYLFLVVALLFAATIVLLIVTWKILVPYEETHPNTTGDEGSTKEKVDVLQLGQDQEWGGDDEKQLLLGK